MVPLGLIILSIDSSRVRRLRRQIEVKHGTSLKKNYPKLAALLGFSNNGNGNGNAKEKPERDANSS